ncbi:MAG: carbohydrate kinase family protein, partial [Candidatus Omnitrophica bacterium]|nr:carbohydrate kinase family protein [Candidatus Omnitrophota bacterium]
MKRSNLVFVKRDCHVATLLALRNHFVISRTKVPEMLCISRGNDVSSEFIQMKFDVIGLGCCSTDFLGVVPAHPPIDVKMQLLDFSQQGGGPVATALVTLARLGCSTGFIGAVGDDELGSFQVREFKKEGVDLKHLKIEEGKRSIFAFIMVDRHTGKRTILWVKSETSDLMPEELNKKYITSAKILHLDGFHPEAAVAAAGWAKSAGIKVVLDAGGEKPGMDEIV